MWSTWSRDPRRSRPRCGAWEDGHGLRITFGEGKLASDAVTCELATGDRTCRWKAALLSYEDGVLQTTTGAQPAGRAPKRKAPRGTYAYQLADRDPHRSRAVLHIGGTYHHTPPRKVRNRSRVAARAPASRLCTEALRPCRTVRATA